MERGLASDVRNHLKSHVFLLRVGSGFFNDINKRIKLREVYFLDQQICEGLPIG